MTDAILSPYSRYLNECQEGYLYFQRDKVGNAIFPPRVLEASDEGPLEWVASVGKGTVYSVTTVHPRNEDPFALALIDLDEGFRMMSSIVEIAPEQVSIGDRVKVNFWNLDADGPALPVFKKEGL